MKKLFITTILFFFIISSHAQSYNGKGDHKINVGYDLYSIGNGIKTTYDYGLGSLFSLGLGVSYYLNNIDEDYGIHARTNFHFGELLDLPSKLDIYPGVEICYLSSENVVFTGYAGVRYFITKNIGVYAEIGNNGTLGLSFNI